MTDKVIEEVDEKYQGQIGSKKKISEVKSIFTELNSTQRQVNKLLGQLRHNSGSVPCRPQIRQNNNKPVSKSKQNQIGKYNYYGKKYRFEEKEQQLNIEPAKIDRQCRSEINEQRKQKKPNSPRTQVNLAQSRQATINNSVFFNDGQIKMPSKNYFIYFDKPDSFKKVSKARLKKEQSALDYNLPQKFKPAWLMQKKINNLQKEVKNLKERQRKRMGESSEMMRSMRSTYDGPIRLKSNIEKMVQSLWQ